METKYYLLTKANDFQCDAVPNLNKVIVEWQCYILAQVSEILENVKEFRKNLPDEHDSVIWYRECTEIKIFKDI